MRSALRRRQPAAVGALSLVHASVFTLARGARHKNLDFGQPVTMGDFFASLSDDTLARASEVMLFLLVGGMAGSCDAAKLRSKFTTASGFKGIGAGVVCQFVLLPLMGFLALTLFPQSQATAIALLVVTSSPGGGFSGFWCYFCNADLALSVAMTTASTLVSVVALPLNLALYITVRSKSPSRHCKPATRGSPPCAFLSLTIRTNTLLLT